MVHEESQLFMWRAVLMESPSAIRTLHNLRCLEIEEAPLGFLGIGN